MSKVLHGQTMVKRASEKATGIIKIESTDRAIDRLVYEFSHSLRFGDNIWVVPEEINIVAGVAPFAVLRECSPRFA